MTLGEFREATKDIPDNVMVRVLFVEGLKQAAYGTVEVQKFPVKDAYGKFHQVISIVTDLNS